VSVLYRSHVRTAPLCLLQLCVRLKKSMDTTRGQAHYGWANANALREACQAQIYLGAPLRLRCWHSTMHNKPYSYAHVLNVAPYGRNVLELCWMTQASQ
jgi:hypothetical protein